MSPAKDSQHGCENTERLLQLERKVVEVQTTTKHLYEDINDLKSAIKECTVALNNLSNKISAEETSTSNNKWFIGVALAVAGLVIGKFL